MATKNFSSADGMLILNGVLISEYGESDPAITIEDINPRMQMKYGLGGGAAKLKPKALRKRLTVNMMPGSAQSRFLVGLGKADITIEGAWVQMGTEETEGFINGVLVSRGSRGRISETPGSLSDDQFVFEFRDSVET